MAASTTQYPSVPIACSELRCIRSSIVGQDYQVKIRLPEKYATTTDFYPVLYLLDGDHAFAMATDIVQYLIYDEYIPDMIIASPAYGVKRDPLYGGTNMRMRDFLPFPLLPPSRYADMPAHADQYLQFFERELIPFVEAEYRVARDNRTIWGYSAGAFFALYALFQTPGLFQKYIVVDGFDERYWGMEREFAAHHADLPARLFMSEGPGENEPPLATLRDRLAGRNYPSLRFEYTLLNDIGHFAVPAEGLTKGLVSVFRK